MEEPRIITLDATTWREVSDFYDALLPAIGAPHWHGKNINALIDSMVWGGINTIEPPYTVRIIHADNLPSRVKQEVADTARYVLEARGEYRQERAEDVVVAFEVI